jgi:5'-nucleotidase
MLRVLLTNDDGIWAPGLRALAARLAARCELQIIAPERPSSAKGQSITLHKPLRVRPVEGLLPSVTPQHLDIYECSGTPADCVIVALHHFFRDRLPHLVISGINDGCNVAQDLPYSGTVGGAQEGAANSISSVALSLAGRRQCSFGQAAEAAELLLSLLVYGHGMSWQRELAQQWATRSSPQADPPLWPVRAEDPVEPDDGTFPYPVRWLDPAAQGLCCFNVNLPDLPPQQIQGVTWARLGHRKYTNIVKEVLDPRGEPYYWIAGDREHETLESGTDTYALARGCIAVTALGYD